MEVYVDDMVAKSEEPSCHVEDLIEVFGQLPKHNMRLNPEKCVFGVESGKFLGFMLSNRGIKVNPDKCEAVISMRIPTLQKDVQRLTGHLASLSRFLPCMTSKARPFFQLVKKKKRLHVD
ncbi:hypothetical protein VNO78_34377 [Psophocarpus tetragonolobus]|uniref:Reverse transcriptase domain-containing protein n=1 Tax=Psophocarpus tetragonolobus TaxID=3891 RepID=A0AAN9P206_PSOTE